MSPHSLEGHVDILGQVNVDVGCGQPCSEDHGLALFVLNPRRFVQEVIIGLIDALFQAIQNWLFLLGDNNSAIVYYYFADILYSQSAILHER